MKIDLTHIKEGRVGKHEVVRFVVEPVDIFYQWRSIFLMGRGCPPGSYVKLVRDDKNVESGKVVVMSNTPDEIKDHLDFILRAEGSVLVNGLGLGMCLTALLEKDSITDITIIERSKEVIDLIAPCFNDSRVIIVNDCAFNFIPPSGKKYNAVWHDIWDFIDPKNLGEMKQLMKKYHKISNWQGCWSKSEAKRMLKVESKIKEMTR